MEGMKEKTLTRSLVILALVCAAVSLRLLFRIEQDRKLAKADDIYLIGQRDPVSRLAYFLWSSMPDEESLRLADGQALREPGALDAHVRKLLTYALGRGLERCDRPAVKKITTRVAANDYRFSSPALEE